MKTDLILLQYRHDRNTIAERIVNDLNFDNIIQIDDECRRAMGSGEYRSPYRCKKCDEISQMTSMRQGEVTSFDIEVGKQTGETIKVIKWDSPVVKIVIEDSESDENRYAHLDRLFHNCGNPNKVNGFIKISKFLNGVLMSYLVEYLLLKNNIPHCLPVEVGFECNRTGYMLRPDEMSIMKVSELDESACIDILYQIAVMLKALSEYNFIHGSATVDRIYLDLFNDCNYEYLDHKVVSNFTVKIAEYHFSSMTLKDHRIFPYSDEVSTKSLNNIVQKEFLGDSMIEKRSVVMYDLEDSTKAETLSNIFRVRSDSSVLFYTMRYSGYPLFGGAYDMYSFLISLMSLPTFARHATNGQNVLNSIITSIFPYPDDVPEVNTSEPLTCSYRVSNYLKGKWLYCDVVDRLLNKIQSTIIV